MTTEPEIITNVADQYLKVFVIRVPIRLRPYLFPSWLSVRGHVSLGIRVTGRPRAGPDAGFLPFPELDYTA